MKLSQLIRQVREDLEEARKPKSDASLSLEECELEISVEIEVNAKGEVAVNVLGTGGKFGSDAVRTTSHKVRVKFSPLPKKSFKDAVVELKLMLEHLKKEGVQQETANGLVSRFLEINPTYIGTPLSSAPLGDFEDS